MFNKTKFFKNITPLLNKHISKLPDYSYSKYFIITPNSNKKERLEAISKFLNNTRYNKY